MGAMPRLFLALLMALAPVAARADVLVFAAASLGGPLDRAAAEFRGSTSGRITLSYGASATLAHQIANGAPADLFLSANEEWMDYLADRRLIDAASRRDLFGNSLVLIAPAATGSEVAIGPNMPLGRLLGDGRLAIGDPAFVPAGEYGKAALAALGLWPQVENRLAPTADVRAALALVARGEAPLGIVYATDAAGVAGVRVVGTFPATSHPPIRYPGALIAGRDDGEARRFLEFLTGDGRRYFLERGFTAP